MIIGVGFIANKVGVMPKESNDFFVALLMKVAVPCMILASITSRTLTDDSLNSTLLVLGCGLVILLVFYYIGFALFKYVLKTPADEIHTYAFTFGSVNNGFIGFPITLAIFGKDALFLMAVNQIALSLYLYTFGPMVIPHGDHREKFSFKKVISSLSHMGTISSLVGIFMLFAGLKLPSMIFDGVDMIGSATTPLSMLVIGMQLGETNFKELLGDLKLIIASVVKMISMPLLTFLAVNPLPMPNEVKVCLVFGACFPVAVATSPVISSLGKSPVPAAKYIAVTTLISIITIPVVASFLLGFY